MKVKHQYIYQLRNEIVRGIGSGQFKYGENLPTVRTLANDLQVNHNDCK